jgi:acyl-CoA synthetase (AMP-forming)/AMP-acid ligase II
MTKELGNEKEAIWSRWYKNAERAPDRDAIIHWVAGEEPFRWTFSALIDTAEGLAATLVEHDIGKGDVCAIIMRHNKILYPLYLAIVCVGAIPAILAYPNPRLHPDKFRQGIDGMFSLNATLRERFALLSKDQAARLKACIFLWNGKLDTC